MDFNWDQIKINYAGLAMQGLLMVDPSNVRTPGWIADKSIEVANKLVERLKLDYEKETSKT